MNKCRIFLVRHTQTTGNVEKRLTGRKDYELTNDGKKFVRLLTEKLKNIKFNAVYSSPAGRSEKTIAPLAKLNNKEIKEQENLSEMCFGIYDGWKWEDVNKIHPEIKQRQNEINIIEGIPGQETTEEVANRVYNCIYNLSNANLGKTILIASHGIAIEAFLRKIDGVKFNEERQKYCQRNTAINELYFENGKFNIIKVANLEHLKELIGNK